MTPPDWPAVRAIYEEGIATGDATFQTEAPSWDEWDAGHLPECRLVSLDDADTIVGWAALSRVSSRCVYAGVAEVSVYVAASARGTGIGRPLLEALVAASERRGLWTLQAGIFPENVASLTLHERCGFRVVGRREKLGQMRGRWRDVLLLERRSASVGVTIYHITSADEARAAALSGIYAPKAFDVERFIHCSYSHQVCGVANRLFGGRADLVLLEIDRARLSCDVIDENLEGGAERFPHVYGRLPMSAVVGVFEFPCAADGRFELPHPVKSSTDGARPR
jgi:L-amino acid N-acyltransferase YncA/uncharacterized protein (DUF952 family)